MIDAKIRAADKQLRQLVAQTGSSLGELTGIGPSGAARLLGDVGDIARFRTAGHFASWNATAPIEASSGDQQRHRLSRVGNRRINRVLHIMAIVSATRPRPRVLPTTLCRGQDHDGRHPIKIRDSLHCGSSDCGRAVASTASRCAIVVKARDSFERWPTIRTRTWCTLQSPDCDCRISAVGEGRMRGSECRCAPSRVSDRRGGWFIVGCAANGRLTASGWRSVGIHDVVVVYTW